MRQPRHTHMLNDPGFGAMVARLVEQARDTHLPSDYQLDSAAVVRPADITAAVALWDMVQRHAGTGLEGVL